MKCKLCEGKGGWNEGPEPGCTWWEDCQHCNGTGKIGLWNWAQCKFWAWAPEWFFEWWADTFYPYKEEGR